MSGFLLGNRHVITGSVHSNIAQVKRKFEQDTQKLPNKVLSALNQAAFEVRTAWVAELPKALDKPIPFTVRSPLYKKATAGNLTAEVYIRNTGGSGPTAPSQYLTPEVFGGARPMKPSEQALGHYYVPAKGAPLDRYGNINFNTLRAILAQVGGRGPLIPSGFRRAGGARGNRGKRYIILHERDGKLPAGVYERQGNSIKLMLFFINRRPSYKAKRFDPYGVANALLLNKQRFKGLIGDIWTR